MCIGGKAEREEGAGVSAEKSREASCFAPMPPVSNGLEGVVVMVVLGGNDSLNILEHLGVYLDA
jgi:hypothetical protein